MSALPHGGLIDRDRLLERIQRSEEIHLKVNAASPHVGTIAAMFEYAKEMVKAERDVTGAPPLAHDPEYPSRHRPATIDYRGKPDSFYVTCACGFMEAIGLWYVEPPPGWDPHGWPALMISLVQMAKVWS